MTRWTASIGKARAWASAVLTSLVVILAAAPALGAGGGWDTVLERGCATPTDCTGWIGRIRFYNQDLMKIRPWCTSNCDTP
jgi:hypothetical protein